MRIAIFGAGSIGCYVGTVLVAGGEDVIFIGRAGLMTAIAGNGLSAKTLGGKTISLLPGQVSFGTSPEAVSKADAVLLCVKSGDTALAIDELKPHLAPGTLVVSLQNGVGNRQSLRAGLPGCEVAGGMVPFNVVRDGTRFTQTTEGAITLEDTPAARILAQKMKTAHIPCELSGEIEAVQWGKLCMNLNNALNVISGMPLKRQLKDRDYRRVLAAAIREALAVAAKAGIRPARIGKVRPQWSPSVLLLPTPLFRILASGMLKTSDEARSSMWEDLQAGRKPEIAYLNGAVVEWGDRLGVAVPVNREIVAIVERVFRDGHSPCLPGAELLARIRKAAERNGASG